MQLEKPVNPSACAEKHSEVGTLEMKVTCMGTSSVSRNWKVTKHGPSCIWNISNMEIRNTIEALNNSQFLLHTPSLCNTLLKHEEELNEFLH